MSEIEVGLGDISEACGGADPQFIWRVDVHR